MKELINKLLSLDGFNQEQREAMLDLIILGMYADNHLAFSENEVLKDFSQSFNWNSSESINYYMNRIIGHFRQIRDDPEAVNETIELIATKLSNQSEQALKILEDMIDADGETVDQESKFYQKVEEALKQN